MNRLWLLLLGCFGEVAVLSLLWALSPHGQSVLSGAGMGLGGIRPADLQPAITLLVGGGFVLLAGCGLRGLSTTVTAAVVGSAARVQDREDVRGALLWGVAAYLALGALFGVVAVLLSQNGGHFEQLLEPRALVTLLRWPYELLSLLHPFGLPLDAFR